MIPIPSAIAAPLPENFTLDFDPSLLLPALLIALVLCAIVALLSAAAGGRGRESVEDLGAFDRVPRLDASRRFASERKRHRVAA